MTTTFEVGKTYATRSVCDYNCVMEWTVTKRTAKRVTLVDRFGRTTVRGVQSDGDAEFCYPDGRYSMCPVITAHKVVAN